MSENESEAGEKREAGGTPGRVRGWVEGHVPAGLAIAAGLTLVVCAAIAVPLLSSKNSELSDAKAELSATQKELKDVEVERDEAVIVAEDIRARRDGIIAAAQDKSERIVGDARKQAKNLEGRIQDTKAELASTEKQLDAVSASLSDARQAKRMSTFGDGTWSVGDDVLAGTYRSSAGGDCYWEILNAPSSGSIDNIVDNGFGPNAVISVSDGQWIRVSRCGKWSAL